jgi:anhydro-N-acetylmuramic acid kinase
MSGTSLDGLDIAACVFTCHEPGEWTYEIVAAETLPYSEDWKERLSGLHLADAFTFARTDADYGKFLGISAAGFIRRTGFAPDLIASHGHTIFHRPELGFTTQIGAGSHLAAESRRPVVSDFRSVDVALGGQGAPLVPIGDRLLFPAFDACLNLGGFGNISMERNGQRVAFDICPVNFVLNHLARRLGKEYDEAGTFASIGSCHPELFHQLNHLTFYKDSGPKSLGREWVEKEIFPLFHLSGLSDSDLLRTFSEHIAYQVNQSLDRTTPAKVLVTGGGARNRFLMKLIAEKGPHLFSLPDELLIDFKEALVFAFLGTLRYSADINVLNSVTGGLEDHCGGSIYRPFLT